MKAILISHRFHPGHVSHLDATARLLSENGFTVSFRLHAKYKHFNQGFSTTFSSLWECIYLGRGDLLITYFPSVSALLELILVKMLTRACTIFVYHEPYTSFASYRESGFGVFQTLRITLIAVVNKLISKFSDKIILPSERAFRAVPTAINQPSRFAKINLIFADESTPSELASQRQWISYIGTIAEDHAFTEFVGLVQQCAIGHLLEPFQFLIASRSVIPPQLLETVASCVASGRLALNVGKPLTNPEINRFYSGSYIVWNAYRRSMQSGVLPKAYMFGTPVIVSRKNIDANFTDEVHGRLVSPNPSLEEFVNAVQFILQNWSEMSRNCREYYLQNFDYRALSNLFMEFIQGDV